MLRLQEMIILVDLENLCTYISIQMLKELVQLKQIIIYQKKVELLRQINQKGIITFFIKSQHHKYQNQELEILIYKVITSVEKEIVTKNNNLENAQSARDTLAKHVYEKLFNWLIDKINQQLLQIKSLSFQNQQQPQLTQYMIGILDIFGFEIFTDVNGLHKNSFEQLNINFTNEKLQQHFNQQMFVTEQKEYEQEQIKWQQIKFPDNKKIIDLIENSQISIYKMLIDQTIVQNRGDKEFINSLEQLPKDHLVLVGDLQTTDIEPRFDKKLHRIAKFDWFCLKHFAGAVAYNVTGFVEKNRDSINSVVFKILPNSTNPVQKKFGLIIDSDSKEEKDVKGKQQQEVQQIEIEQQQQQQPPIKKEINQQGLFKKLTVISQPNSKEIKMQEYIKLQEFVQSKEIEIYEEKLNQLMKDQNAEEKFREQMQKFENEISRRDQIIDEYSKQIKQSISISEVQDSQLQKQNELMKLYQDQIKSPNMGWRIKILENECLFTYFNLKTYQQKLIINYLISANI